MRQLTGHRVSLRGGVDRCPPKGSSEVSDVPIRLQQQMARNGEEKEQQLVVLKLMVKCKSNAGCTQVYRPWDHHCWLCTEMQASLLNKPILATEDFWIIFCFPHATILGHCYISFCNFPCKQQEKGGNCKADGRCGSPSLSHFNLHFGDGVLSVQELLKHWGTLSPAWHCLIISMWQI